MDNNLNRSQSPSSGFSPDMFASSDEILYPRITIGEPLLPSPYIIRLYRKTDEAVFQAIRDLAQQLEDQDLIDGEEEADLAVFDQHGLAIRADDVTHQLRDEQMREIAPVRAAVIVPPRQMVIERQVEYVSAHLVPPVEDVYDAILTRLHEGPSVSLTQYPVLPEATRVRHSSPLRATLAFSALALLVALPVQGFQAIALARQDGEAVLDKGKGALDAFLRGATSATGQEFGSAQEDFQGAASAFLEAEQSLSQLQGSAAAVVKVIPQTDRTVSTVEGLVAAGGSLSEAARIMSMAAEDISSGASTTAVDKIELLVTYIESTLPHIEAAERSLERVDLTVVPAEYSASVQVLRERTPQVATAMREFIVFSDALVTILGADAKTRYLFAFQNNTEIRPTGGFVGSFAEVDIQDGEIVRLHVPPGGSYAVQGQLQAFVAAPGPLQLLSARWEFQDANWFPDFPTSAEKMLWFSGEAGGPTMDGVVAVNATFVERMLTVLGPVELPEYGITLDGENFIWETRRIVDEANEDGGDAPKAILSSLAPILLERMKDADMPTLLASLDVVGTALEQKDLLVYFSDNEVQSRMEQLGWTGSIKQTDGDYLMVTNTNLGGGKTDTVIDQRVDVDVRIASDGSVENTVTITKTHRGMKSALLTGVNNVDYLRLYVPQGSELLVAEGFEVPLDEAFEVPEYPLAIDEDLALHMGNPRKHTQSGSDVWDEQGKTVFGNWMQTAPGEVQVVRFTYKLPFTVLTPSTDPQWLTLAKDSLGVRQADRYTLFVQKQPGIISRSTAVRVSLPETVAPVWSSLGGETMTTEITNDRDRLFGWLFEAK